MLGLSAMDAASPGPGDPQTLREQEAAAIRNVASAMSLCSQHDGPGRHDALTANAQLWLGLMGALAEPAHQMPLSVRAQLISVGVAVCREVRKHEPDVELLIAINQQIAAGLYDASPAAQPDRFRRPD